MSEVVTGHKKIQRKMAAEELMRKFTESRKEKCIYVQNLEALPTIVSVKPKTLPTGSTYTGARNHLDMNGHGVYTYPNGWVYKGKFREGQFHGEGQLLSPKGELIRGTWVHGNLIDGTLYFRDGQKFIPLGWQYLKNFDRRFYIEQLKGLRPAPDSFKTADQPTKLIPPGLYDTCDGFYNPSQNVIISYDCNTDILRCPTKPEQHWITSNCRNADDAPIGYHPALYEFFYKPLKYLSGEFTADSSESGDAGCEDKCNTVLPCTCLNGNNNEVTTPNKMH